MRIPEWVKELCYLAIGVGVLWLFGMVWSFHIEQVQREAVAQYLSDNDCRCENDY